MNRPGTVHVVVPHGVADPRRPSGGNTYDRRLCAELAALGWAVRLRPVAGCWPWPDRAAHDGLAGVLEAIPDGSVVVVDGLVALPAPDALLPASRRLRVVVLVHTPLTLLEVGDDVRAREAAVLQASSGVVTTSGWTRGRLVGGHGLDPARTWVAEPGVDPAARVPGSPAGGRLLCVGAVTPEKGHDLLVAALAGVADLNWRCTCAGALDLAPGFVAGCVRDVRSAGLDDRVELTGPLARPDLDAAYAAADVLVLASRVETYGMVVTEALARGLPVIACDVGGVPEALGTGPDGRRPGLLTPAGDAAALAGSLRRWLTDPGLRRDLRCEAGGRRGELAGWAETAGTVARLLEEVAA